MNILKLASLFMIGAMLPVCGADQGVENDDWDIVENQQTAVRTQKNATTEKDTQPGEIEVLKNRLEAVEAQLKSALEANRNQAELKKAANENAAARTKRKVNVRVAYDASGGDSDQTCVVDGVIWVDSEMTLGEIRKLASQAALHHNSGSHGNECLQRIREALVHGYRFKHAAGWLGCEQGSADHKLSSFEKENQSDVYFSN